MNFKEYLTEKEKITKDTIWFHGRKHPSKDFNIKYTGGEKAKDQE